MNEAGGYVEAVNRVPYMRRLDKVVSTLQKAVQSRQRDIETNLRKAIERAIAYHNREKK